MVRLRAVGVVAAAALLAACTAPWQPDGARTPTASPTASPTATPPPPSASVNWPTVVGGSVVASTSGGTSATSQMKICLLYTSPSPRDGLLSRMPSSA